MRRNVGEGKTGGVVEVLVAAYRSGLFPMAEPYTGTIVWCSPEMRGVLPLREAEGLHLSRSVRRAVRRGRFEIRCDTSFERVVRACAVRSEAEGTWIDERIVRWYGAMHEADRAHCFEAWRTDPATGEERLVGGVYGVSIGAAFFGESMFSRPRPRREDGSRDPFDGTDASKVCLIELVRHLDACGYEMFDTQMWNEHIAQFGVREIPRDDYLERLDRACRAGDAWRDFDGTGG